MSDDDLDVDAALVAATEEDVVAPPDPTPDREGGGDVRDVTKPQVEEPLENGAVNIAQENLEPNAEGGEEEDDTLQEGEGAPWRGGEEDNNNNRCCCPP